MKSEKMKKWLEYQQKGVKPTLYKFSTIVFSTDTLAVPVHFALKEQTLSLLPLMDNEIPRGLIEGYGAAFRCEVTYKDDNKFNIQETLDLILPIIGFDYRLPIEYKKWEEYEGQWLEVTVVYASGSQLISHPDLPPNTHSIVAAYEKLSGRTDKRSKKAVAIRSRLKEAIRLENISRRYSFLSYYSIIEIVSDDLAAARDCPSGDKIAQEIANFALSSKGSQRTKLYFLLRAIPNDLNITNCIEIADIRNDIAHGNLTVSKGHLDLCKKVAFLASESLVLRLIETAF